MIRSLLAGIISFLMIPGTLCLAKTDLVPFLEAEDLELISFDQSIFFFSPDGSKNAAPAGMYRLDLDGEASLRLTRQTDKEIMFIPAASTKHQDDVTSPVALCVVDDRKYVHLVLLLPGGRGLEAIGTYTGPRTRGLGPALLSPSDVHEALLGKINSRNRIP